MGELTYKPVIIASLLFITCSCRHVSPWPTFKMNYNLYDRFSSVGRERRT